MSNCKKLNIKETKSNIFDIENNETLKRFLNSVKKYKPLSVEDEVRLFNEYKTAGEDRKIEIRNEIIERNQMLVYSIAKRYGTDDNILDLISEGNLGLTAAFRDFNVDSGNRFCTYATFYIRKDILKYIAEGSMVVKRKNNLRVFFLLDKIRDEFVNENGCQPTYEDIREIFDEEYGVKIAKNEDVYDIYFNRINGFWDDEDKMAYENSRELTKHAHINNECLETFDEEYNVEVIRELTKCLNDNEKLIIELAFGLDGYDDEATNKDIAELIGMSQERVRQIKNKALAKMKRYAVQAVARV